MKIALYNLTTTTKLGGVESIVWDVGQRLAERGHDVTLFGGRGKIDRPAPGVRVRRYPYIARETWGRARVLRKSLNLLKLLERLSMAAWAVPDLMAGRFDIVQVVKPYDFPVAAHVRHYGGARMVYNSHGTDFFPGDILFRRSIDGAFACSRYNATMVEAHYHVPIGVSYNGYDSGLFRPVPPDPALRARHAPDGAPLLLYAGRLVTFKGIDHLLDAVALLNGVPPERVLAQEPSKDTSRQADKQTSEGGLSPSLAVSLSPSLAVSRPPRLVLAGEGPHRANLEARAARLGIADRVSFLGAVPHTDLPALHAASDLFVMPSTDHETFCLAACEAMSCARPVVASRTGGLVEVVRDGESGLLATPGDPADLAAKIGALLSDAALRARMGAAGREWTLEMFTWEKVIARMLACYDRVLAHS
jgi:glycosyltransferase involved in cell wall biosynthesis